ncbi:glycine zipper 2TM domain-containing protein [Erythrobacter insulae]|uniref:17 kDa surface antigen n=2 Tax=Erythrobacter insulae TaxID=2584124 RepID=A0A547PFB3_9SPHN|nr:glycine zipper 2TM domain-containing protein [Erythrobacter insulae]
MKSLALIAAAGSLTALSVPSQAAEFIDIPITSAMSINASAGLTMDPPPHAKAYGKRAKDRNRRIYDDRGYYVEPRRISRADRVWRGRDGRYYCQRDNGTTGLIIGAGVGALAGSELARDKTLGAVLGGAVGALLGREIDRGSIRCR